jgi:hypothetical protein
MDLAFLVEPLLSLKKSSTRTPKQERGKHCRCFNLPFAAKCWWLKLGFSRPLKKKKAA